MCAHLLGLQRLYDEAVFASLGFDSRFVCGQKRRCLEGSCVGGASVVDIAEDCTVDLLPPRPDGAADALALTDGRRRILRPGLPKLITFNAKFIILNTRSIILNTKFIICQIPSRTSPAPLTTVRNPASNIGQNQSKNQSKITGKPNYKSHLRAHGG